MSASHSSTPHTKPPTKGPRILITRLSAHGDVIQTLPLLGLLRQHCPNAYIGWVVEKNAAPLLEGHPDIHQIHISHRKSWFSQLKQNPLSFFTIAQEAWTFFKGIRRQQYDISIDVQGLFKSAIIPFLAIIPIRLGYDKTREMGSLFYTDKLNYHDLTNPSLPTTIKFSEAVGHPKISNFKPLKHVEALKQNLPYPIPTLPRQQKERLRVLLETSPPPLKGQPTIAIAPATMWPSKQWPQAHWKALLEKLVLHPVNIIVIGSPDDAKTFQSIFPAYQGNHQAHMLNLMGKTQIQDLYELFQHVDIMIGPDSAPMHIANAVACNTSSDNKNNRRETKPYIMALFGPTGPQRTGPIGCSGETLRVEPQLPCQPCFKRRCPISEADTAPANSPTKSKTENHMACQTNLSPDTVYQAICNQLKTQEENRQQKVSTGE